MLPVIEGVIRRRMLLNFRADADVVQRLLPSPLRVDRQRGYAVVGVCLIRLEDLTPHGVPGLLGLSSENMAHRVAIQYPTEDGMRPGVFIWRRETDQRLMELLGGRLFPGVHHNARFRVLEDEGSLTMAITTKGRRSRRKFLRQLFRRMARLAQLPDVCRSLGILSQRRLRFLMRLAW